MKEKDNYCTQRTRVCACAVCMSRVSTCKYAERDTWLCTRLLEDSLCRHFRLYSEDVLHHRKSCSSDVHGHKRLSCVRTPDGNTCSLGRFRFPDGRLLSECVVHVAPSLSCIEVLVSNPASSSVSSCLVRTFPQPAAVKLVTRFTRHSLPH